MKKIDRVVMHESQFKRLLLLSSPGAVFLVIFLFAPLVFLLVESFRPGGAWSISSYTTIVPKMTFRAALFRTLRIGFIVTSLAVVLGYPTAYVIARMRSTMKALFMALAVFPLMTTAVIRTFGWYVILGYHGVINSLLLAMGLVQQPVRYMYTEGAIIIGLLHLFLPLMLLSLISSFENIAPEIEEAAQSLGARPLRAFFRVVFPLSTDGLVIGGTLVFTGAITAYATPAILGGTRVLTLSTLLYQRAMTLADWDGATAIAIILLFIAITINAFLTQFRRRGAVARNNET